MKWKSVVSLVLSVASICAHTIGLSYASLGLTAVASGGHAPENAARIAGFGTTLAMILAPVAMICAVVAWPKESFWVRMFVLCLSVGAVLWSLIIV